MAIKRCDKTLEVYSLTLKGLSAAEIGSRLGIAASTVCGYLNRIYAEEGVSGKKEFREKHANKGEI